MLARPDVSSVYAERQIVYESAATLIVDTDARSPEDVGGENPTI